MLGGAAAPGRELLQTAPGQGQHMGHSGAGQHGLSSVLEVQTHTRVPGWHTGLAQTLGAKPCPETRAQMSRCISDPELVLHVLRGCDPSLEEVRIRSPACSLPRAQAALGEVGEGPVVQLHGMKRVSTSVIRRETGGKRWRKTGCPSGVPTTCKTSQTSLSELFSKEKETRCSGTPQREDKVTYWDRAGGPG